MAIRIDTTRQSLADAYAMLGTFFGLATDDPGTTAAPVHEASGGSYARVATTWTSGAAGVETGSACIVNVNPGTYTFVILCKTATGDTMIDNSAMTTTFLNGPGTIILNPAYTQS
jgi:hypothetical protein